MDARSLSNLLLRVAGLVIVINAMGAIPAGMAEILLPWFRGHPPEMSVVVFLLFGHVFALLMGLALLKFPNTIAATLLLVDTSEATPATPLPQLQELVLFGIGFYLLASGVVDTSYWLAKIMYLYRISAADTHYTGQAVLGAREVGGIVSTAIQIVIGLGLTLGFRRLRRLVLALRR